MGKFNYTNRKSEGIRLGQIVAKDLRKRVAAPTSSTSPSSSKSAESTALELNLQGKSLTDEGFMEVAAALQEVIRPQQLEHRLQENLLPKRKPQPLQQIGQPRYRLEELNLSNNALSIQSLVYLSIVVRLAAPTLRELDLSGNEVSVCSDVEAEAWAMFLESFRLCEKLRTLDLSRNRLGGSKPFEVLARLSVRHAFDDGLSTTMRLKALLSTTPVLSSGEYDEGGKHGIVEKMGELNVDGEDSSALVPKTTGESSIPQKGLDVSGLRSIPSLILSDCQITDAGALFLSTAIIHYRPRHCPRNSRRRSSASAATHANGGGLHADVKGIAYLPNRSLTPLGQKLLENANVIARELAEEEQKRLAEIYSLRENVIATEPEPFYSLSQNIVRRRRSDTVSSGLGNTEDLPEFKASARINYESLCRKIQRSTIEQLTPGSVQIWAVALRMLTYVRNLSMCKLEVHTGVMEQNISLSGATLYDLPQNAICSVASALTPQPNGKSTVSSDSPSPRTLYAGIDFSKREALKPATPGHSLLHFPVQDDIDGVASSSGARYSDRSCVWHRKLPGKLPPHIWRRIIALSVDAVDVLTDRQQDEIFAWAVSRQSLARERDWLRKPESTQIWRLLDSVDCLTYEMC